MANFASSIEIDGFIENLIAEDSANNDITTNSIINEDRECSAAIVIKNQGVLCGVHLAERVFMKVDSSTKVHTLFEDGARVSKGDVVLDVKGRARSILAGERISLNLMQHLSGISTLTAQFVDSVKSTKAVIIDTRKTLPGIRKFQKYAVTAGGGRNHRMNLSDGILIKDNHIHLSSIDGLSMHDIVMKAKENVPHSVQIEIEVETLEQLRDVMKADPDIILLDNMDIEMIRMAVEINNGKALLEASGGVNLNNVKEIAETGVDMISIGALTHSCEALDMSLNILITKTDAIKNMFLHEFPPSGLIKHYKDFEDFRDATKRTWDITRTKSNAPDGVDFWDDEIDIPEINRFIKTLPAE